MMWTTATGQLEGTIDVDSKKPLSVCTTPDGKCMVSFHEKGVVRVWRVERRGSAAK
jgi:hypothetical protein